MDFKENYRTPSERIRLYTYIFLFIACIVNFTQCGAVVSSEAKTGVDVSTGSADEQMLEMDFDLYETGPVSLPKELDLLQNLDPDQISVTSNVAATHYVIRGEEGITTGDRVYAYNVSTGVSDIASVTENGFDIFISAKPQEQVALAVINDEKTTMGIPIYVSHDGVTDIALTNSDRLTVNTPIVSENNYLYFAQQGSSETKNTLMRLSIKTRYSDVIAANQKSAIQHISVIGDTEEMLLGLQNGRFQKIAVKTSSSSLNDILTAPILKTTWHSPALLWENEIVAGQKAFYESSGGMYICSDYVKYIDSSGKEFNLLSEPNYIIQDCDRGRDDFLYVLAKRKSSSIQDKPTINTVYQLSLSAGKEAFTNAEIIWSYDDGVNGTTFESFDVNGDDDEWIVAAGVRENGSQMTLTYSTQTKTQTVLNDSEVTEDLLSQIVRIAPDGVVFQCSSEGDYLVANVNNYYLLKEATTDHSCSDNVIVDDQGRLFFYKFVADEPQIAFINMTSIDYTLLD